MACTHAAFAVYSDITTQDGRHLKGYATFNEYQSDAEPDTSSLVQDYPVDFYASVARLEAGVILAAVAASLTVTSIIGARAGHLNVATTLVRTLAIGIGTIGVSYIAGRLVF